MGCPQDNTELDLTELQSVGTEYNPSSQVLYLESGEQDMFIERKKDLLSAINKQFPRNDRRRESYNKKMKRDGILGDFLTLSKGQLVVII